MWAKILAFLLPIAESEFTALAPIAVNQVAKLGAAELTAVQSGDATNSGHILAGVVRDTASQAAIAGITAGAPAVLAAVGHAISPPN